MRGRLRHRLGRIDRRDAGHEAVGQALLISIGIGAMVAAGRLADISTGGMTILIEALR